MKLVFGERGTASRNRYPGPRVSLIKHNGKMLQKGHFYDEKAAPWKKKNPLFSY